MDQSPIMSALAAFDVTKANLEKLESLLREAQTLASSGLTPGSSAEYDEARRLFEAVVAALPAIGGWKLDAFLPVPSSTGNVSSVFKEAERLVRHYGDRLRQKRRELVREPLIAVVAKIDQTLQKIRSEIGPSPSTHIDPPHWPELVAEYKGLRVLLGENVPFKARWHEMGRHLGFGMIQDFNDIEKMDWPSVKVAVNSGLYGEKEPIPLQMADLADMVAAKPGGSVSQQLNWQSIDAHQFERLLYRLISSEPGYENPQWLMKTNAPDRGRDLSVSRVRNDGLSGTLRERVIIQCRHLQSGSIGVADVTLLREQMSLWGEPPVDVLVIATSGRFTADAVQWIEKRNHGKRSPMIEMWAESHLEGLLAARPSLIAEFGLR
jgi:hypothetical protein